MTDKRDISSVDVAVVVSSCDAYGDAWEPFFHSFFKYWPDCPFPVYLVAGEKTYDDSIVKTIRISEKNWSICMKTAFAVIPERIILYLQEDYFLKWWVDTGKMIHFVDTLKKERAACLRLYPDPKPDDRYKDCKDIGSIRRDAPYRLSLQAALWDKKALDSLLIAGEDPWQTELIGSKRTAGVEQPFLSVKRNSKWMKRVSPVFEYICTAIIRGRWTYDAIAFCKREGLTVDLSRRPMEEYGQHMRRHMSNLPLVGGSFKFFSDPRKR
jgi:hypothetical protein